MCPQDLCERHEKGVLNEHQRAIQKMGHYKKRQMSATRQTSVEAGTVEQLEQRILEVCGVIPVYKKVEHQALWNFSYLCANG